jgi:hypothetical protein
MGRNQAHLPTGTFKALAGNLGSLLLVFNLTLTQLEEEEKKEKKLGPPSPPGMMQLLPNISNF